MKTPGSFNVVASVRQRLLNLRARYPGDFNVLLTRYAAERLLYRLSISPHSPQFVLKGALLFVVWLPQWHRPTRDLDLLGFGENSVERLTNLFREICQTEVAADGLEFDPASLEVTEIREGQEYGGRRVRLLALLGNARVPVQVDVGFGDSITPGPCEIDYPTLLSDLPAPKLRAYPRETVVAEKLEAMVALGWANSRMKDFYDLLTLAQQFDFTGSLLAAAIHATFQRRKTVLPTALPPALRVEEFGRSADKITQWQAFLRRNALAEPSEDFAQAVEALQRFLALPLTAAAALERNTFSSNWSAGGPWKE